MGGVPQNGWFIMEKNNVFGVPHHFRKPPDIYHISIDPIEWQVVYLCSSFIILVAMIAMTVHNMFRNLSCFLVGESKIL